MSISATSGFSQEAAVDFFGAGSISKEHEWLLEVDDNFQHSIYVKERTIQLHAHLFDMMCKALTPFLGESLVWYLCYVCEIYIKLQAALFAKNLNTFYLLFILKQSKY